MNDNAIVATIRSLEEVSLLEAAGQILTSEQLLQIIDAVSRHVLPKKKLLPLLVGLPSEVFAGVLTKANSLQLDYLKLESVTEPIQHHLTVLANKAQKAGEDIGTGLLLLVKEIQQLDVNELERKDLESLKKKLENDQEFHHQLISLTSKALAIEWNTNRLDLIEKYTHLKEHSLITLHDYIGSPSNGEDPGTGLYEQLENRLFSVFKITEGLKDTDPATEALALFSIWYLKDYWTVGLLPSIKSEEELEFEDEDEIQKRDQRQKLFILVQENLIHLGIGTVGDLKKNEVFSKKFLSDYIKDNQSKLTTS